MTQIIRETQIKPQWVITSQLLRELFSKKTSVNEDMEKTELLVGKQNAVIMENNTDIPKNIKNRIPYSNSTFGFIPKGNKNSILKRYLYAFIHCSLIHHGHYMEST